MVFPGLGFCGGVFSGAGLSDGDEGCAVAVGETVALALPLGAGDSAAALDGAGVGVGETVGGGELQAEKLNTMAPASEIRANRRIELNVTRPGTVGATRSGPAS